MRDVAGTAGPLHSVRAETSLAQGEPWKRLVADSLILIVPERSQRMPASARRESAEMAEGSPAIERIALPAAAAACLALEARGIQVAQYAALAYKPDA